MEKNNVKTADEERLGSHFPVWIKRYSPFAFETLKEIPWPTWTLPIALIFFLVIQHIFERNANTVPLIGSGDLSNFIQTERGTSPRHPTVLLGGSSVSGYSILTPLLEQRLSQPCTEISNGLGTVWETHRILMRYHSEAKNVKCVIVDLSPQFLYDTQRPEPQIVVYKNRFLFFKNVNDLFSDGHYPMPGCERAGWLEILLPVRVSLKNLNQWNKTEKFSGHEDARKYAEPAPKEYRDMFLNVCKNRNSSVQPQAVAYSQLTRQSRINPKIKKCLFDFVEYCHKKGIHVVFFTSPRINDAGIPLPTTSEHGEREYLALADDLNDLENCTVIKCRSFEEITPEYGDYFFDPIHMTKEGATIYTNWLVDQIQKDPNIVAALDKPRAKEDFFVQKYAKKGYRKIANYLNKSQKNETVQVAEMPGASIR